MEGRAVEPTNDAPAPRTIARPDGRFVALVQIGACAAAAASVGLVVLALSAGVRMSPLLVIPCVILLVASAGRADVAELGAVADAVDVVDHDGRVRRHARSDVGGVAVAGAVVAGHLVPSPFVPSAFGRLIVTDRSGAVVSARRAAWLRVDDVAAVVGTAGIPWLGRWEGASPTVTEPPRPDRSALDAPPAIAAGAHPPTEAAAARIRRRVRTRALQVGLGLPLVTAASMVLLGATTAGGPLRPIAGVIAVVGGIAVVFALPILVVWSGQTRAIGRVLRRGDPWRATEAIILSQVGRTGDRVVGLVSDGPVEWWTVQWGGSEGWLQGDERRRLWIVRRRRRAVVSLPGGAPLGVLSRRPFHGDVWAAADARLGEAQLVAYDNRPAGTPAGPFGQSAESSETR